MESKVSLLIVISLIAGLIGGYLVGSINLQGQVISQNIELGNKQTEINQLRESNSALQTNVTVLKNQIRVLQSTIELMQNPSQYQSAQAQTQVRIDSVIWGTSGAASIVLDIRNTGSVDAILECVAIRKNVAGSSALLIPVSTTIPTGAHGAVPPSGTLSLTALLPSYAASTSYVIRVTTNTGFYYEAVFTSPDAQSQDQSTQAQTQVRIDSVTWGSNFSQLTGLDVRNTGSVDATLESVSIRTNDAGSPTYVASVTNAIGTGSHLVVGSISPTGFTWAHSTSYVIRVTTTTDFYYEAVFMSPV